MPFGQEPDFICKKRENVTFEARMTLTSKGCDQPQDRARYRVTMRRMIQ
jgi:hypothetical protein